MFSTSSLSLRVRSFLRQWTSAAIFPMQFLSSHLCPQLALFSLQQIYFYGSFSCPLQLHEPLFPFSVSLFNSFPLLVPHPLCSLFLQLLCQNPLHRLRYLHHFQLHPFFRGVAFDPELLQKQPVNFVMKTQATQYSPLESMLFKDFDCDLDSYLVHPSPA